MGRGWKRAGSARAPRQSLTRQQDQRRQAGGEDDAAKLSPFPLQRGAAVAEPNRLQPWQPVAAAGAAGADRRLVADQLAAAAGENPRAVDKACALLLVAPGGGSSGALALRQHAAENRDAAVASRIGGPQSGADFGDEIGRQRDKCLRTRLEKRQFRVFYANARQNWSVAGPWKAPWT